MQNNKAVFLAISTQKSIVGKKLGRILGGPTSFVRPQNGPWGTDLKNARINAIRCVLYMSMVHLNGAENAPPELVFAPIDS